MENQSEHATSGAAIAILMPQLIEIRALELTPAKLFKELCPISTAFNSICHENRLLAWEVFFSQDILPFLADDSGVKPAIRSLLTGTSGSELTNFQIYKTLYLAGFSEIKQMAWYHAERRAGQIRNLASFRIHHFPPESIPILTTEDRLNIVKTGDRIRKICDLRHRNKTPPSAFDPQYVFTLRLRVVLNFMEFALWTLDGKLLEEIVKSWYPWFYDYKTTAYDLLKRMIEELLSIAEHSSYFENPTGIRDLITKFNQLFQHRTQENPLGRHCPTYSDQVKELLKPMYDQASHEYTGTGDRFLEEGWDF